MGSTESDLVMKAEAFLASAKNFKGDRVQRRDLLKQVDLLYLELEDPMDSLMRQWSFMNASASIDVMVKLGGFEKIPKQGSISAKELGTQIHLEPTVLARIMRMLTASGIIALTGEDEYAHTPRSRVYLQGAAADFWNMCMNMSASYRSWPEYFKTKSSEELLDLRKTPYSYAYGEEGKTFYEILTLDTDRLNMFNKCMMQQDLNLPTLGMFPFTSLKDAVIAEPERAFVVDIAGGRGHCLMLIKQETSNVFGTGAKMVLEDRPPVLDTIPEEELPGVEKIGYDFYTEQPIKNAHIYWLRRIMHNYQDEVCIKILKNIAAAMGPTSRLLIAEALIPTQSTTGEDMGAYIMDMVMISIGGKERNEKEYLTLLDAVGLELVKIWPFVVGAQVVLECKLKKT